MTCIDIYKNINIVARQNVLAISPCCVSPIRPVEAVDFLNNEYLVSLRNEISTGQLPTECSSCKDAEAAGLTSRRQGSNSGSSPRCS